MLTKKQLEDAAECLTQFHKKTCGQCSCNKFRYGYVGSYGCTENTAQTALAYREMLKELEWCSIDYENRTESCCPVCGGWQKEGHIDDCELAALLKEEDEEG